MQENKNINNEFHVGDWVVAAEDKYGYLIGKVTKTGDFEDACDFDDPNETYIRVDFSAYDYPPSRIEETEKLIEKADLLPYLKLNMKNLKQVVLPAKSFINLAFLGNDMSKIKMFGDSLEGTKKFCEALSEVISGKCISKEQEQDNKLAKLIEVGENEILDVISAMENTTGKKKFRYIKVLAELYQIHQILRDWRLDEKDITNINFDFLLTFKAPFRAMIDTSYQYMDHTADIEVSKDYVCRMIATFCDTSPRWQSQFPLADDCGDSKTKKKEKNTTKNYIHHVAGQSITINTDAISLDGYTDTWYVVDETDYHGQKVFLLEHEVFGDETEHLAVNENGTVLVDEIYDNWIAALDERLNIMPNLWG